MSRARTFPCTVSVDVSGLAAQGSSRPDVVSAIVDQFGTMPLAAVQFFGTEAKVTFEQGYLCFVTRPTLLMFVTVFAR